MTKLIDNPTEPPPEPPKSPKHWLRRVLQPSKKKAVVIIIIASLGGIAYLGLDCWLKRNLPLIIESYGSKLLNRPVKVGKVKSFSLTAITLDSISFPATATDKDYVVIDAVRVGFNLFPVILHRTLAVDLTLMQPKAYLEQEGDGSWLNLNLPLQQVAEVPRFLDISAKIKQGNLQIVPYRKSSLKINLDLEGRYNPQNQGQIEYDLEATIAKAQATLQGETFLETGTTTAKLLIQDLALTDAVSVIPNASVNLTQGVVNADLDVNIPSLSEFTSANIEGILRVGEVRGEVASRDIEGKSWLRFGGSKVEVQQTQGRIETIEAKVSGAVDLQQGYDLDLAILPFDLATLPKTLATELPVPVTGEVKGDIQLRGDIEQPRITGTISNTKPLTIDQESLTTLSAKFSADLDKFTLQDLRIIPRVGGIVRVTGEIATNLQQSLATNQEIDPAKMPLDFTLKADLPTQTIASSYWQFPDKTSVGNFSSEGTVTGTIADPQLLLQWRIRQAAVLGEPLKGEGKIFFANQNIQLQDSFLEVGTGKIAVEGTSNLEQKTWQTAIAGKDLSLTPFLSQLPLAGINLNHPVIVNNAQANLSGKLDKISPDKMQGLAIINLDFNNNPVTLNSSLNQGEINATVNTETIALNQYIPNLATPVTIQSSKFEISSQIAPLLSEKPDLSRVSSNINANLLVAEGIVTAQGSLQNNQWQGNIQGNNLKPSLLSTQFSEKLAPVNTNIQLSGNLPTFITQPENLFLKAEQIEITMGQQYLKASGDIVLANLLTNPDIANVALEVDTFLDFNNLYLQELISNNYPQSLINIPKILGQAELVGKLRGKNLISNPTQPGNFFLAGDITLNNLTVQDTVFDSVMKGNISIDPNAQNAIVIQGKQDIFEVALEPCVSSRCRFPYLPNTLKARINDNQNTSIIATGNRQGNIFQVKIAQFPLAVLNITPAKPIGLDFPLEGIVTGDLDINLFSLGTSGKITVEKPGIEYLEADKFAVNFNYDVERNFAEIAAASLLLKDSEYNLNGNIDLNSGQIQGKLDIPQAYIQDILTTLGWYSIADAIDLWDYVEFASAEAIKLNNIKTSGKSIGHKLQLLANIEQEFQEKIAAQINSNLPTQLDITGGYSGDVLIAGNIANPEINFAINAQDWQWRTQTTLTTFLPDQGLVKLNAQVIALPQIQLQGKVKDKNLNLDIAKLQLGDATFSASGTFSPNQQNLKFELNNLSVDTISKLVRIPGDIKGTINTNGTFKGTIKQPELSGNIIFTDGVLNQQQLAANIVGDYSYQNQKFNFNITKPESIQIAASIPYPIQPQINDRVTANIKLSTEAFTLINALTKNNLTWIAGAANAEIVATANIDLNQAELFDNVEARGKVILEQVQIKTPLITETITTNGQITLDNQLVDVKRLKAKIGNKDLSITGKFPLLDTVDNLANPLTINIPSENIILKEIYQGRVAGNIILTGTALKPIISGEVALENGKFSIPKYLWEQNSAVSVTTSNIPNRNSPSRYQVLAKDFSVKLDDFRLKTQSLSKLSKLVNLEILRPLELSGFKMEGELNLNGPLNDISQLKGEGTFKIIKGVVGWLTTNLFLVRDRENLIVFNPDTKIINPYLDIELRSDVEELRQVRQLDPGANEILDGILDANRIRRIDVRVHVEGKVEEILGTIAQTDTCDISPDNVTITANSSYSHSELEKLDNCVKSNRSLLGVSAITISSTPYRTEGQIVNLLGYQSLFLDPNNRDNSLLNLAFAQFVYKPIEKRYLFEANNFIVGVGKKFGIDELRVFPFIEMSSQLGNSNFYLRGIYDPKIIRTQSSASEANTNREVYEIRLEFRPKF